MMFIKKKEKEKTVHINKYNLNIYFLNIKIFKLVKVKNIIKYLYQKGVNQHD